MKDRFDLENEINELHFYINQLDMINDNILNHESDLDKDTVANAIQGVSTLMGLYANKLFDTMQQVFKLDHYKDYKEIV
jgi:hypothetical protein